MIIRSFNSMKYKLILLAIFLLITGLPLYSREIKNKSEAINKEGYIEVADGRLFYDMAGSGETIVFIHDGLIHHETYDNQVPYFSKDFRVIRYDRRGYGKSDIPKSTYSNIEDLKTVFDTLKVDKAYLVGCSAGGGLTIDFTLSYPEKVSGLVLVGSVLSGFSYTDHMLTRGGHISQDDYKSVDALITYYLIKDPYEMYFKNEETKRKALDLMKKNPHNLNLQIHSLQRAPEKPALGRLANIKVPVLIVVGEYDIPDVHALAGAIDAGIPQARRVVLNNAGHLVHMEQPDDFNRLVSEFLKEIPFLKTIEENGIKSGVEYFEKIRRDNPSAFVFSERTTNRLAYQYLQGGKIDEAIELFKLNVIAYPQSFNVYDSLAEGYQAKGEKELAIKNYKKSLQLNPNNTNAVNKIRELERE